MSVVSEGVWVWACVCERCWVCGCVGEWVSSYSLYWYVSKRLTRILAHRWPSRGN